MWSRSSRGWRTTRRFVRIAVEDVSGGPSPSGARDRKTLVTFTLTSHPQRPPEPPRRVVRLRAVVVGEDGIVAAVAEEGAAEFADVRRRLDPARGFQVELAELLEGSVLLFGQELDSHRSGHVDGVVFRAGLFPRVLPFTVKGSAAAAGGAF